MEGVPVGLHLQEKGVMGKAFWICFGIFAMIIIVVGTVMGLSQ